MIRFMLSALVIVLAAVVSAAPVTISHAEVPAPLRAVSCGVPTMCLAVGDQSAVWNGSTWTARGAPGQLNRVSCVSATWCMAVGGTIVAEWTRAKWTMRPLPSPGHHGYPLTDISCASGVMCIAVGGNVIALWNGKTWGVVQTPHFPHDAGLSAVSCSSAKACMAVGSYLYPSPSRLGLSCGGTPCAGGLAAQWNGTAWTFRHLPLLHPPKVDVVPNNTSLSDLSCTAATACTAVGVDQYDGQRIGIAAQWNGKHWAVRPLLTPDGVSVKLGFVDPRGVACSNARHCLAVGDYFGAAASASTSAPVVAEQWDGATWTLLPIPALGGGRTVSHSLGGISCTAPDRCEAVGVTYENGGVGPTNEVPLMEGWNGTRWTLQSM